jgi:hypothetical protein
MVRCATEDPFEELPAENSEVEVELKSGETKQVNVTKRVWEGEALEGSGRVGLYALD